MKRHVPVELLEKPYPVTNQHGQHRITNFVREPETKALSGNDAASHKPDATEFRTQAFNYQLFEIAGVELNALASARQIPRRENKCRLVAVGPAKSLLLKIQRRLIRPRPH